MKQMLLNILRRLSQINNYLFTFLILSSFCFLLISLDLNDLLESYGFEELIKIYSFIKLFINTSTMQEEPLSYLIIFISFSFILILIISKLFFKPRLLIIEHKTFENNIESFDTSKIPNTLIKKESINFENYFIDRMDTDAIISLQDQVVNNIKKKYKNYTYAYYGIAHIPLIFRLGFQIGDSANMRFFHKNRSNQSSFVEWNHEISSKIDIDVSEIINKDSRQLIVALSISFEIQDSHINSLDLKSVNILKIKSNILGFDVITSYYDAEMVKNKIINRIRAFCQSNNIEEIHFLISASSSFICYLATGFSHTHDPKIRVYHFERNKYSWYSEV